MHLLDDLSGLGPPISNNAGRAFVLSTAAAFVYVTAYTARPRWARLGVTGLFVADIYLLLTMPDLMGHFAGFDPLISNFIAGDLLRVIDLYFLRDDEPAHSKKENGVVPDATPGPARTTRSSTARARRNGAAPETRNGATPEKNSSATAVSTTTSTAGPPPGMSRFHHAPALGAFDYLIMNHRNVGTPYQVKSLPKFSKTDPTYVPSRKRFLGQKVATCIVAYLTLDLLTCQPAPPPYLYAPDKDHVFRRLGEVTPPEVLNRAVTAFNMWFSTWLLIQYCYAIVSFVAVASTVYEPRDFPPLTGTVDDSYTVRTHWGVTWHQVLQSPYVSTAKGITRLVLPPAQRRTLFGRYVFNFFVFACCAFTHVISPLGSTHGYAQLLGTWQFIPLQTLGLMIEDGVIALYKRATGRSTAGRWAYYLGYLWVIAWFTWSVPIWVYPTLRRGGEGMVPYSFIRRTYQGKEIWKWK